MIFPMIFSMIFPCPRSPTAIQELAAEALSQDTERLEIDITLGAGAAGALRSGSPGSPRVPQWSPLFQVMVIHDWMVTGAPAMT